MPNDLDDLIPTAPIRNRSYVAKPAPGYDRHGLWHVFESSAHTGYATHAAALQWALHDECGIPTQIVPGRFTDIDPTLFPQDREEALMRWYRCAVGVPHLMFASLPPEAAAQAASYGPPLIPYCAFEGTMVSDDVRDLCNSDAFRELWVVSTFVEDALVASGVRADRVHTIPPVLCGGPWPPVVRGGASEEAFVFGSMGTWQKRKGYDRLFASYFEHFGAEDDVVLAIRTSAMREGTTVRETLDMVKADLSPLAEAAGYLPLTERDSRRPRVRIIAGTGATDEEVIRWLGTLDCYVNASFGEGLGIPQVWAKAAGVPMISSDYGAVGELLTSIQRHGGDSDFIMPSRLVSVDPDVMKYSTMYHPACQWGDYDEAELGSLMRAAYDRGRVHDAVGEKVVAGRHGESAAEHVNARISELLPADALSQIQRFAD